MVLRRLAAGITDQLNQQVRIARIDRREQVLGLPQRHREGSQQADGQS
jgi:hypothetical protein